MKHNLLLGLMLLISFTGCARQGTTHTLQKGTKKVYVTEATIKVPAHETVHMSVEQQYKVVDETADGYVLDILTKDIQKDEKNPPGMSFSAALSIMEGKHCQYATDKEGRVLRSLSINDSTTMKEEKDLESLQGTISPLALNGKNIVDGMEEEYCDRNGLKMKRTYHVKPNGSIQSNAMLNMKAEDIRELCKNKLKKAGINLPKEAQQTLDKMVENFSMEYTEEATYTFLPDGWVKTIDCVITQKVSEGAPITMTYKVYVK